ncbi:MAG: hypothetical protein HQM14_17700 [SAR324 cluster bacterium]|nr:hypothetical protein [SAR324 cluster bacterium]
MSEASKKSQYQVRPIIAKDLSLPWYCEKLKDYKTKLALLKKSMEERYPVFSENVSLLLNQVDETKQVRRIMPKNEWVLAYYIRVLINKKVHNYILMVGAEVSTKPKSIAYGEAKDHYDCQNCYYVLGSQEILNEKKFGPPSGGRQVREVLFHEYNTNRIEIHELVAQLLKIIMAKENIQIDKN